jgi:Ca2+/H+ antiporter, TMEM165/GDT1 family
VEALATTFGLVFLAELGDKSMVLALAFATRYRPWPVLGGIAIAAFAMLGLSPSLAPHSVPRCPSRPWPSGAGVLFIGFGLWTLRPEDEEDETAEVRGSSVLLGVTGAFLVAEFGDKTMLATATLAATQPALPTWLGAGLGMTVASGIAIVVGAVLGARIPERVTRIAAGVAFLAFGVWLLIDGLTGG